MSSFFILSTTKHLNKLINKLARLSLESTKIVNNLINRTEVLKYNKNKSKVY